MMLSAEIRSRLIFEDKGFVGHKLVNLIEPALIIKISLAELRAVAEQDFFLAVRKHYPAQVYFSD